MPATPEFDYVIVGAGSAGSVLAGRLSADPTVRVLLLEAGGWDWHPLIRIPLGVGRIWGFDRFDWGYETEPEPHAGGRRIETARRKGIGGSPSLHANGYIPRHPRGYHPRASPRLPGLALADARP